MANQQNLLSAYGRLQEPVLLFDRGKTDTHPLRGLSIHGPYGIGLGFPSQVRLAYFAPLDAMEKLDRFVTELNGVADPIEALNYYIHYKGFQNIFRIPLLKATDGLKFGAATDCLTKVLQKDGHGLVDSILQSIGNLLRQRNSFDVLLIYRIRIAKPI